MIIKNVKQIAKKFDIKYKKVASMCGFEGVKGINHVVYLAAYGTELTDEEAYRFYLNLKKDCEQQLKAVESQLKELRPIVEGKIKKLQAVIK